MKRKSFDMEIQCPNCKTKETNDFYDTMTNAVPTSLFSQKIQLNIPKVMYVSQLTIKSVFCLLLIIFLTTVSNAQDVETPSPIKNIQIFESNDEEKTINVSIEEIRNRIINGEPVHFVKDQKEEKRKIESSWIIKVLKKKGKEKIDIKNAIITGDLDFRIKDNHVDIDETGIDASTIEEQIKKYKIGKVFLISHSIHIENCQLEDRLKAGPDDNLDSIVVFEKSFMLSGHSKVIKADFEGAIFNDEANFSLSTFNGKMDFRRVTFEGEANFKKATFNGKTDFRRVNFNNNAYFPEAAFKGEADFDAATFNNGNTDFRRITFDGEANFVEATFIGKANFLLSTFNNDAYFDDATFNGVADFRSVNFNNNAYFPYAAFKGEADFRRVTFDGEAHFVEATFIGKANFVLSTFNGGSSLITLGNISDWDALLLEIKGDTKKLTTILLTSKLEEANQLENFKTIGVNQLTDKKKEDIVTAFDAIKDNLTFYKDEVAGNGIELSPDVLKELNNLNEILEKSGELKKKEYDLSDLQKEDIKWFNIAILKELFPQILSKSLNGNANFKNATFNGKADFTKTTFTSDANFESVESIRNVRFDGAHFYKKLSLIDAYFKADINFDNVEFNSKDEKSFVDLRNFNYSHIVTNWRTLKGLIKHPFSEIKDINIEVSKKMESCKKKDMSELTAGELSKYLHKLDILIDWDQVYINLVINFQKLGDYQSAKDAYYYYKLKRRFYKIKDYKSLIDIITEGTQDLPLITVFNISDWGALLLEIQGDTKNLTTKLLTSKLEEADQLENFKTIGVKQLTDEKKEEIVTAFNAIKDNLTFYKDEVAVEGIERSPDVLKELNNLNEILEESGELKKKEYDLSHSQKEDIKWFNIAVLQELFPQILSKSRVKEERDIKNEYIYGRGMWQKTNEKMYYIFFGMTCGYGVKPFRSLVVASIVICFFTLLYSIGCHFYDWNGDLLLNKENPLSKSKKPLLSKAYNCFYFSITSFTGGVYGDITPDGSYKTIAMIESIMGWLIFGLFLVSLANVHLTMKY